MDENISIIKTGGKKCKYECEHAIDFLRYNEVGIGIFEVGDISDMHEDKLLKEARKKYGKQGSRLTKELIRFRDEIEVGDPVIAYRLDNTVLAVGRITSGYFFDKKRNKDSKKGLGLPHRRKVDWIEEKQNFSRYELQDPVCEKVALRKKFYTIPYDFKKIFKNSIMNKLLDRLDQIKK